MEILEFIIGFADTFPKFIKRFKKSSSVVLALAAVLIVTSFMNIDNSLLIIVWLILTLSIAIIGGIIMSKDPD